MQAYRGRLARLLGAPRADCVVPKTSAGQGLRAILNTYDARAARRRHARRVRFARRDPARVRAPRAHRADAGRAARRRPVRRPPTSCAAIGARADLVVVSQVIFKTGQRIAELPRHRRGNARGGRARAARHLPRARRVSVRRRGARRGLRRRRRYKYLRGGPGACFLYLHPRHLDGAPAHARHRLVREARPVRLPAARSAATTAPAATRCSNRRRRCCRSTRRAPDRCSRWRSAWRACARSRSRCSGGWSPCSRNAAYRGDRRDRRIAARSSRASTSARRRGRTRWPRRGVVTDARGR